MPRPSAGACGRASTRWTSTASGSCSSCSSTAWSSPVTPSRSATRSPPDRRASGSRFVYCEQTIKSVLTLHGVDERGRPILRRDLSRARFEEFLGKTPPTELVLEACGSSHHWGRVAQALGHKVRLIPPQYVKPFVKRGKNDRNDAEAICEAASRPTMRSVPVKPAESQAEAMDLSARDLLVRQRTRLANAVRGHAAEFGVIAAKGIAQVEPLLARIAEADMPPAAEATLAHPGRCIEQLDA